MCVLVCVLVYVVVCGGVRYTKHSNMNITHPHASTRTLLHIHSPTHTHTHMYIPVACVADTGSSRYVANNIQNAVANNTVNMPGVCVFIV